MKQRDEQAEHFPSPHLRTSWKESRSRPLLFSDGRAKGLRTITLMLQQASAWEEHNSALQHGKPQEKVLFLKQGVKLILMQTPFHCFQVLLKGP